MTNPAENIYTIGDDPVGPINVQEIHRKAAKARSEAISAFVETGTAMVKSLAGRILPANRSEIPPSFERKPG